MRGWVQIAPTYAVLGRYGQTEYRSPFCIKQKRVKGLQSPWSSPKQKETAVVASSSKSLNVIVDLFFFDFVGVAERDPSCSLSMSAVEREEGLLLRDVARLLGVVKP